MTTNLHMHETCSKAIRLQLHRDCILHYTLGVIVVKKAHCTTGNDSSRHANDFHDFTCTCPSRAATNGPATCCSSKGCLQTPCRLSSKMPVLLNG